MVGDILVVGFDMGGFPCALEGPGEGLKFSSVAGLRAGGKGEAGVPGGVVKVVDTKASNPERRITLVGTRAIRVDDVPTFAVPREEEG